MPSQRKAAAHQAAPQVRLTEIPAPTPAHAPPDIREPGSTSFGTVEPETNSLRV